MALVRAYARQEAARYNLPVEDIFSPSRIQFVAWVRWHVFQRLRDDGYSLPGIARRFGQDHTTVLNGLNNLKRPKYQNIPTINEDYGGFLDWWRENRNKRMLETKLSPTAKAKKWRPKVKPPARVVLTATPPPAASAYTPSTFIRPIPRERLMAGRA